MFGGSILFDILTVFFVSLAIWMFFRRRKQRKHAKQAVQAVDIAYEYVAEPAGVANAEMRETFSEDALNLADGAADATLVRLVLVNKGSANVEAERFQRPITVEWPSGTAFLDIGLTESAGLPNGFAEPAIDGDRLTIDPFAFQSGGRIVLNIVTTGPVGPVVADGWFDGQGGLYRLSAGRPRAWTR